MDLGIFEELGLTSIEAKIYISLLELGQSKTGRIIDKTKLQSSTIYHTLGSLIEKGLVSYIHKGKIKYYQAENPDSLMVYLEDKKKKLKEILPELKEKERLNKQKQNAKIFEGVNGLKTAYGDILENLKKGEEYYFFQLPAEKLQNEEINLFLKNYHIKRAERGIVVKGIASRECKIIMKEICDLPHTEIKFMEEPSPTVLVIYKNKILMIDWDEKPICFLIQSETISKSYRKFFMEKWKQAKK